MSISNRLSAAYSDSSSNLMPYNFRILDDSMTLTGIYRANIIGFVRSRNFAEPRIDTFNAVPRAKDFVKFGQGLSYRDVWFLDYDMPVMTGIDFFQYLQKEGFEGISLLITSSEKEGVLEEAEARGITRAVSKKHMQSPNNFIQTLEEVLEL
jgi:CheY-like chemotaxis protein